jgi:hypothetical protein
MLLLTITPLRLTWRYCPPLVRLTRITSFCDVPPIRTIPASMLTAPSATAGTT